MAIRSIVVGGSTVALAITFQIDIPFTARESMRIYATTVLGVVILSVRLSHACIVTN